MIFLLRKYSDGFISDFIKLSRKRSLIPEQKWRNRREILNQIRNIRQTLKQRRFSGSTAEARLYYQKPAATATTLFHDPGPAGRQARQRTRIKTWPRGKKEFHYLQMMWLPENPKSIFRQIIRSDQSVSKQLSSQCTYDKQYHFSSRAGEENW